MTIMIVSCGNKKKKMAGEDDVNLQDFVDFFPEAQLPFIYADTALYAKTDDSLLISADIFNEFTPDSILSATFGADKPNLYAIGKFSEKEGIVYLMSKAATAKNKAMFISAYNNKNEFIAAMQVMKSQKEKGISTLVTIDKLFNINKKTIKKLPNGVEISGDDIYVLNSAARKFMLIMTDALGDDAEVINPIDTLSRNYKYAGDYGVGSRNIISIRDNIKPGRVQFYIHLEEKNSQCSGELKGEANITSDNTIIYKKPGDPCALQFEFDKNGVTLKELEGCGSRMGALDCTFNGKYPKKKASKK
ncbi:hypothetical protein U0035_00615 [Niabella yanshanensis]|uniref:Uncharacterized protein n=1 Tax=Niabella yanshanensis TaxID=577386 RepID=A0ABZ0W5Y4_9BACT|nr:hypothetical protein [Niabella yanshanensis]WQD38647.1 hypothetical protein U0035_00615 [Niabella yanshanensis]